jgi:hypothetical protein
MHYVPLMNRSDESNTDDFISKPPRKEQAAIDRASRVVQNYRLRNYDSHRVLSANVLR